MSEEKGVKFPRPYKRTLKILSTILSIVFFTLGIYLWILDLSRAEALWDRAVWVIISTILGFNFYVLRQLDTFDNKAERRIFIIEYIICAFVITLLILFYYYISNILLEGI